MIKLKLLFIWWRVKGFIANLYLLVMKQQTRVRLESTSSSLSTALAKAEVLDELHGELWDWVADTAINEDNIHTMRMLKRQMRTRRIAGVGTTFYMDCCNDENLLEPY